MGFFRVFWIFHFKKICLDFLGFFGFFILNFFLTHDSHFKSALKYTRSNLGNDHGDLQWKLAKKRKNPFQVGFFMFRFLCFLGGFFGVNPALKLFL